MRKVQIVRRPVRLSLGPSPKPAATPPDPLPAFETDALELDTQTIDEANLPGDTIEGTLDIPADDVALGAIAAEGTRGAFDAFDAIEDDELDEPTIVTPTTPPIATPRTSTSTVSASKRLEVIKQTRGTR